MNSYCFLYNPSTNRRKSGHKFEKLKRNIENWENVVYKESKNRDHLKSLARKAAQNFDVVVACGGDGTVRDVAVAIHNTKARLGVVPLGSGNDFTKSLGLPKDLSAILQVLHKGESRKIDLGKCNDFYFINTLGFGFDGLTNLYASQSTISWGTLRYILAALKTAYHIKPFKARIEVDGKIVPVKEWLMLTVANGRVEGGNFIVAPNASLYDNRFTFLSVEAVSKSILPFLLPIFLAGCPELSSKVSSQEGQHFSIEFDHPIHIHTDGEQIVTEDTRFSIQVIPDALEVLC